MIIQILFSEYRASNNSHIYMAQIKVMITLAILFFSTQVYKVRGM